MPQSRKMSLAEVCASTAFGYTVSLAVQLTIYPALGIHVTLGQNLFVVAVFTVVSVIRSYVFRRLFNRWGQ